VAPTENRSVRASSVELHRVVRAGQVDAVVVDFDHARVRELRERVELALKQRADLALLPRIARWREQLERERSLTAVVDHAVDTRHPPAAELATDLVSTPKTRGSRPWLGAARS
jgi:hypothetical protein